MGNVLDSVTCGDQYIDRATCGPVWPSNGGYFAVTGHDVYAQLGARQGGNSDIIWGSEIHVPVCNGTLFPDTYAIRFRNYRAGQNAVVSVGLFTKQEPTLNVGAASSTAVLTGTVNVQHNGALVGTEPSIDFEDGGIVWTVTDDAGGTRVKIVGTVASAGGAVVAHAEGWAGGGAANVNTQSVISGVTASATTGLLIPASTLGTGGSGVKLLLAGQFEAGTSNETNVIAITFGGTTFWQGSFASNPGGSGYTCEYRLEAIIYNDRTLHPPSQNFIVGLLHMNLQSPGAAVDGSLQALQQSITPIVFATSRAQDHENVDTSVDQYLDVVYGATGSQPRFYRVLAVATTT